MNGTGEAGMMPRRDEEYRTTRRREWDEAGKRYGHLSGGPLADLMRQATEEIFRNAALAPGQHLLDVGTGAGSPALEAIALVGPAGKVTGIDRSEEPTSELQSLMRTSYAVFCLKKTKYRTTTQESLENIKL